jgi:phosphoribosyl-ATP pyrophosphohydrolase
MDTKPEIKCDDILAHFGAEPQLLKEIEEIAELYGAIKSGNTHDVLCELADVWIMMTQVDSIITDTLKKFNLSDTALGNMIDKKIARTLERIEDGYYGKH